MRMKLFNGKIQSDHLIFIIAWSLFILTVLLQETIWYTNIEGGAVTLMFKLIRYIAYMLCIWVCIYKHIKNVVLVCILLLVAGLALSMVGSTNKTMFLYFLVIIGAYGINSTTIIKVSLFWQLVVVFGTVLLSQTGLIEDYLFGDYIRLRHGLGFNWATVAPIIFFYCMLQYIYLRREKVRLYEYIIMEVINYILFKLTDSRMAFYFSTLFLAFFFFANLVKRTPLKVKIGKWKYGLCALPAVAAVGSVLLHAFYDEHNGLYSTLNVLLSKRLELGFAAIRDHGITWLGQKIEWIGFSSKPLAGEYNYVDCSYLQLLIEYGILFLLIVIVIYTILIYRAVKAQDNYLLVILCIVLVFSITEPRLMNFAYNPFPVLVMSMLATADTVSGSEKDRTGIIYIDHWRKKRQKISG